MRYLSLAIFVLLPLLALPSFAADAAPAKRPPVKIVIIGENWDAPAESVRKLLESVAQERMADFPGRKLDPILVSHWTKVPITLNQKGPHGEYQVRLPASSTHWAQYTYEFAHEMGHILANYDHRRGGQNIWFEEALCETSSLYVVSRMHHAWETAPPYPNWKNWGEHFDHYLNALLAEEARRLPPDMTMKQWLAANLPELKKQNRLTERSKLVAAYLYPLFERDPAGWETLNWINMDPKDSDLDFEHYLQAWKDRLPEKKKPFVTKLQGLFGLAR